MTISRFLSFLLVAAVIHSCSEKQDFGQFDDLQITPTLEASMIYIEAPENIINAVNGVYSISQEFNFDAFSEDFFSERVIEGVVIYEVENTTSKEILIESEFLDVDGNILDAESFIINPEPTPIQTEEIPYGPGGRSITIIQNTSSIRITAENLGDNSSTSSQSDPKIILRSMGKFRLRLR